MSDTERSRLLYDLYSYVQDNDLRTVQDFMAYLLLDLRSGVHLDWYETFFQDSWFRSKVRLSCHAQAAGTLRMHADVLRVKMSLSEGCAMFNAIGGGTDAAEVM